MSDNRGERNRPSLVNLFDWRRAKESHGLRHDRVLDNEPSELERTVLTRIDEFPKYARQLSLALEYAKHDPDGSLNKSRNALEQVLFALWDGNRDKLPGRSAQLSLSDMLNNPQFRNLIAPSTRERIKTALRLCNLGSHGSDLPQSAAETALHHLCDVLEWYRRDYPELAQDSAVLSPHTATHEAITEPKPGNGKIKWYHWVSLASAVAIVAIVVLGRWARPQLVSPPDSSTFLDEGDHKPTRLQWVHSFFTQSCRVIIRYRKEHNGHRDPQGQNAQPLDRREHTTPENHLEAREVVRGHGTYEWQVCTAWGLICSRERSFAYHDSVLDRIKERHELRFGYDADGAPPFVEIDKNRPQATSGFDVDLAQEIASRLRLDLGIERLRLIKVPLDWKRDIQAPERYYDKFDIVISAVSVTEDRRKHDDFSIPYFLTRQVLVKRVSLPIAIAVQNGTTSADVVELLIKKREYTNSKPWPYKTVSEVLDAYFSQKTDAVVIDEAIYDHADPNSEGSKPGTKSNTPARTSPSDENINTQETQPDCLRSENYAIMLPKGDLRLKDKIDRILRALQSENWKSTHLHVKGREISEALDERKCMFPNPDPTGNP